MVVSTKSPALFAGTRFIASPGITIPANISFIGYFEPSEPKNIANLFTESNSHMLRAGLEIRPLQIVNHRLAR